MAASPRGMSAADRRGRQSQILRGVSAAVRLVLVMTGLRLSPSTSTASPASPKIPSVAGIPMRWVIAAAAEATRTAAERVHREWRSALRRGSRRASGADARSRPGRENRRTALMAAMPLLPLFGISFGWIFTEMGRQPWLVAGVMPTEAGISPTTSAGDVLFSLIVYTLLYGLLAVIEVGLFLRYTAKGLPEVTEPKVSEDPDAPMSFAY